MIFKPSTWLWICVFLLALSANAFAETQQTDKTPDAFVPESTHKFEKVVEGAEVTYDFVIENKGDAPLNVEKVKTG
jgi:hypothetical protein